MYSYSKNLNNWSWLSVKILLAVVFGTALTLSFAPSDAWWFSSFCLMGLFLLLAETSVWQASLIGFSFGLGWFASGFWWMVPALNHYSASGLVFSFFLTSILVLYLSLFPAIATALSRYYRWTQTKNIIDTTLHCTAIAIVWTSMEWLRGCLFGGMPWLITGYAQVSGPFSGFGPLMGVFGLSFLNALVAALLANILGDLKNWKKKWVFCILAIVSIGMGGQALQSVSWTSDTGRSLSVRLLQGNLSQHEKFTQEGFNRALSLYGNLANNSNAQLTVLPETALPFEWFSLPEGVVPTWKKIAHDRNTAIVIGTVVAKPGSSGETDTTNSAVVVTPESSENSYNYRYDKFHLVPFGETIPSGAEWIGKRLSLNFGTFVPGEETQKPLILPGAIVALSICFENLFDTTIARKAQDAEVILNITNFGWFTETYAPAQHLQAARMRALETGRWFIQGSNTGMTALIDTHGIIHDTLPADVTGVLDGSVKLFTGSTPFMRYGNVPLLIFFMSLMGYLVFRPVKSKNATKKV